MLCQIGQREKQLNATLPRSLSFCQGQCFLVPAPSPPFKLLLHTYNRFLYTSCSDTSSSSHVFTPLLPASTSLTKHPNHARVHPRGFILPLKSSLHLYFGLVFSVFHSPVAHSDIFLAYLLSCIWHDVCIFFYI